MANVVTWEVLRDLADVRDDSGCALSVYVDLDPSSSPTPADVATRFNSLLSGIEKSYLGEHEDGPRRRAIQADLDRLQKFLVEEFDRDGAQGLAVFVSSEQGFFRGLSLAEPVPDHVELDSALSLAPLVAHVGKHEGALVAMIDRERGRLFRLRAGRLEEVADETEDQPGQHAQGGWSQARYQRHIENLVLKHLKTVGDEVQTRLRRTDAPQLVIVAPEELRSEIESVLSPEARSAIVGWASAEAHATPGELLEVVRPHLDHSLAAREQEALERWREEMGKNARGAAGWHDTLEAASDARIDLLLLADGVEHDAYRCPACGRASNDADSCPLDGTPLESHDGVDLAVHQTLACGGTVLSVGGDLLGGEGVGALLRF